MKMTISSSPRFFLQSAYRGKQFFKTEGKKYKEKTGKHSDSL